MTGYSSVGEHIHNKIYILSKQTRKDWYKKQIKVNHFNKKSCLQLCNENKKGRNDVHAEKEAGKRLPCGKVTTLCVALQQKVKQEVKSPFTNLTGRHVHTSSQEISQRAVFCHLLLEKESR